MNIKFTPHANRFVPGPFPKAWDYALSMTKKDRAKKFKEISNNKNATS